MESFMVIKVKYGETLRRFNARVADDKLALNMDGLRDKIFQLFNFAPDTEVTLTYIDEDGDVVTLVDDEDLQDITTQGLDPLRISVSLNTEKIKRPSATSSGNSTPLRSPQFQSTVPNKNSNGSNLLKSLPEFGRKDRLRHSADMASTAQEIAELSKALTKIGLSSSKKTSVSQPASETGPQGPASGSTTGVTVTKDSISCGVDEPTSQALPSVISGEPSSKLKEPSPAVNAEEETSKAVGNPKNFIQYIEAAKPKSFLPDLNVTPCESLSKGPKANTCVVDGKKEEGKKFGDCHLVGKALDISYSSDSCSVGCNGSSSGMLSDAIRFPGLYPKIGGPVETDAIPPQYSACEIPFKRSHNHSDDSTTIFHRGIRCDGCGVHPIIGTRFNSKVKEDYDLCSICFHQMGNDADYIRMDCPLIYHQAKASWGLYDPYGKTWAPTAPQVFQGCGVKPVMPKLDSHFIEDVTVLDGTIMAPLTPFTKIWRMRNNGNIAWPQGTQLVWIGGDRLTDAFSVELQIPSVGLAIGQELDVVVDVTAPELHGRYISYWRMSSPSGQKFGQRVWVLIQVDTSVNLPKEFLDKASHDFNLNFNPASSGLAGAETVNANAEPIVEDIIPEPKISNPTMELVEPVVDGISNKEGSTSSTNSSPLSSFGDNSSISASGSSISYPIDLTEAAPDGTPDAPASVTEMQTSSRYLRGNSEVETTLLKELEEMGFKEVDLNKKILRKNEYDLDLAVDDLCGVAKYDPMLEELEEMGFHNKAKNKMLLEINNGSIHRVVMDLIAEEN